MRCLDVVSASTISRISIHALTQKNAILCEKASSHREIDAATDYVPSAKGRTVRFPGALTAESMPIVSMICPRLRLPSREPLRTC